MRRPKKVVDAERAAASVAALVGGPRKKKRRSGPGKQSIARTMGEMDRMRSDRDWSSARPTHLVALYCRLHEWCYDVPASEVVGLSWLAAASAAAKMVREEFDDLEATIEFMRWVWKRERKRELWRREHGHDGGRIGWRLQFQQRHLVTDYRIALARRKK